MYCERYQKRRKVRGQPALDTIQPGKELIVNNRRNTLLCTLRIRLGRNRQLAVSRSSRQHFGFMGRLIRIATAKKTQKNVYVNNGAIVNSSLLGWVRNVSAG